MSEPSKMYASKKLMKEYKTINEASDLPFTVGLEDENNLFSWIVSIEGPESTPYEGGVFQASLDFPQTYPNNPPKMKFLTPIWHPNIYKNGEVCISILHEPEFDQFNEMETLDEKWRPVLGVREIVLSVLSLLSEPNIESNANIDASIQYRDDKPGFKKKVRNMIDNQ